MTMNRVIKFRAWDKQKNEMAEDVWFVRGFHVLQQHESFELMQYTGIKDKNDKEIYEGDVISINKKKAKIISFFDGAFFAGDRRLYQSIANFSEIIGNIYENSHLLNEVQNAPVSDTTKAK